MSRNDLKKMLVLSNLDNKKIVDQFLADLADVEHTSSSVQAEKCLLDAALPKNEEAEIYIRNMYVMDQPVNQVLQHIFEHMGAGLDEKPRYNNGLNLVRYCEQLSLIDESALDDTNAMWSDFIYEMHLFTNLLKKNADVKGTTEADHAAKLVTDLLDMLNDNPISVRVHNIWHIVLNNWSYLCNYKTSYRMMSDLSALETGLPNNPESRVKLVNIIKQMSTEWN